MTIVIITGSAFFVLLVIKMSIEFRLRHVFNSSFVQIFKERGQICSVLKGLKKFQNNFSTYSTLQSQYNLCERKEFETQYQSIAKKYELTVISYYSLASSFLIGKYRNENDLNKSKRGYDVKKYLNERGFGILKALDEIYEELNTTQAAVSLGWLMKQETVAAPIVSATSQSQFESFVKAAELDLNPEYIEKLNLMSEWI